MSYYYSDPTAAKAMGNLNREYSKQVKKAKTLRTLYEKGTLSAKELEKAHEQFKGLYKYVLDNVLAEERK